MVAPFLLLPAAMLPLAGPATRTADGADRLPFGPGRAALGIAPLRDGYVQGVLGRRLPGRPEASAAVPAVGPASVPRPVRPAPADGRVLPLQLERGAPVAALSNDAFARAYRLPGPGSSIREDTRGATREVGEPAGCGAAGTVWFAFTAPTGHALTLSSYGSQYAASFTVYQAAIDVAAMQPVGACTRRLATLQPAAGATYLVQVSAGGLLALHLVLAPGTGTLTLESTSRLGRPAVSADSPSLSEDTRWVAFSSSDYDMNDADPAATPRGYLIPRTCVQLPLEPRRYSVRSCGIIMWQRDRRSGTVTRVGGGYELAGSGDGSLLVFRASLGKSVESVYAWSRATGQTEPLALQPDGTPAEGPAQRPLPSADGRFVAYAMDADTVVPGTDGAITSTYVRTVAGHRSVLVRTAAGRQPAEATVPLCLSATGRYAVVYSRDRAFLSTRLAADADYYRVDLQTGQVDPVSVAMDGHAANAAARYPQFPTGQCISDDGRYVVFLSSASDLVPGDRNGAADVFVRDVVAGSTERVSVSSSGAEADGLTGDGRYLRTPVGYVCPDPYLGDCDGDFSSSRVGMAISRDGRYVTFGSEATNLTDDADLNNGADVFRHDRLTGQTILLSRPQVVGTGESYGRPMIAAGGDAVVFQSTRANLTDPRSLTASGVQVYLWRAD